MTLGPRNCMGQCKPYKDCTANRVTSDHAWTFILTLNLTQTLSLTLSRATL